MNLKYIGVFFLICLGSLSAQKFSAKILSDEKNIVKQGNQTINVLAVMVEFQPDKFELTYGDGTFGSIYSKDYGNTIIDPLPHDKNYFEDHLKFSQNYFEKSSNGIVKINYEVIPEVVKVSKVMREYSPDEKGGFKILGDFASEVWTLAEQQNPNLDFSQFDMFVIFHAGVGKDISTSTLLGEPRDLPSIYLSLNSMKKYYGNNFDGITLSNGFKITNTAILPETESREESGFGGTVLIELSINGLLVSNIASYLGLPDLFDSETGKSAIGRFGLMDGQSLLAFSGLFPPEPSAWEKVFLGWEEPTVINIDRTDINIVPRLEFALNQEQIKIAKIPINSTEYYLIENRQRDVFKDGIKITYKLGGSVRSISFPEDLDNFNSSVIDTLNGVVIDVDEFDWATPGNGILIWHIDEKIINDNLDSNKINVGKNRGVDLEEADGIQDIGEEFQTIFGDLVIAEGGEYDYWYSSNSSELYQNKFSDDTKPNTNTNSRGKSLISIYNFSDISNQMKFSVKFGNEFLKLKSVNQLPQNIDEFKTVNGKTFGISQNNLSIIGTNAIIPNFSNSNFCTAGNNETSYFFGIYENNLNIGIFDTVFIKKQNKIIGKCTSPIIANPISDNEFDLFYGTEDGKVYVYSYNVLSSDSAILKNTYQTDIGKLSQISVLADYFVSAGSNKIKDNDGTEISFPDEIDKVILTKDKNGNFISIILCNNSIYLFRRNSGSSEKIFSNEENIKNISLADLKNDGENYIIFNQKNKIYALNIAGNIADSFPFILNDNDDFTGFSVSADVNGDNLADLISVSENGNIYAVSGKDGKIVPGFPITLGGKYSGKQIISNTETALSYSALTNLNTVYTWNLNSSGNVNWGSEFGNNLNSSSINSAKNDNFISTFFPQNRTYNWPNPVYGNETYIRTYVSEDSKVNVKIFDIAGDFVEELNFNAVGGIDSEVSWNVSNIQSGAYLARVEVKSNSGKTENKIIKIAVVK